MPREPMKTIAGMSVRGEVDARIMLAREDARALAFDEAIRFLGACGHIDAAETLRIAAFEAQGGSGHVSQ